MSYQLLDEPSLQIFRRSHKAYLKFLLLWILLVGAIFPTLVSQEMEYLNHHALRAGAYVGSPIGTAIVVLSICFIGYLWRVLFEALYVTDKGLTWKNLPLLNWSEMQRVTVITPLTLQYILVQADSGHYTRIPWPLDNPIEFERLCRQLAAPDNPLVNFLADCSSKQKKDGGFPKQYAPKRPES